MHAESTPMREIPLALEGLLDLSGDALLARQADGTIVAWNAACEDLLGHSRDAALGRNYHDLLAPLGDGLPEGGAWEGSLEVCSSSGERFQLILLRTVQAGHAGLFLERFRLPDGERPRLAAVLRDSEERLAKAQEIGHFGAWEWDCRTLRLSCSAYLFRLFGLDPARGQPTWDDFLACFHPEDAGTLRELAGQTLASGDPFETELRLSRQDGSVGVVACTGERVCDADGQGIKLVGICQDVTAHHASRLALRESEERFRRLAEAAFEGIVMHENGRIIEINDAFATMFGYDPADMVGMSVLELVTSASRDTVGQAIADRPSRSYECVGLRKNGETFSLEVHPRAIVFQGRPMRVTAVRDVSEARRAENVVREAEEHLRQVLAACPAVIHLMRWNGEKFQGVWVAGNVERVLGFADHEVLASGWWEAHVHPDDREGVLARHRRLFDEGHVAFEYRFRCKDGGYRWILSELRLLPEQGDHPREAVGAWLDITEKKQAEEELKRSEWRLRKAQAVAHFGWWERDVASGLIEVADETRRIYDLPAGEVVTIWSFIDRLHPDDRGHVRQTIEQAVEDHQPFAYDLRTRLQDGSYRSIHSQGEVLAGPDGQAYQIIGVAQDRTRQVAAEGAMRESEAKLRAVIEQTSDMVFIKDMAGRYVLVNQPTAALLGLAVEQMIGRHDEDLFGAEIGANLREADRRVMASGTTLLIEESFHHACGEYKTYLTLKYPYRSDDGSVLGIIGISHDITERKALEAELHSQNERLVQLDRLKVDFVNSVSHELRAPLTSVMGYAEFLEDSLPAGIGDDVREYLGQIQKGAKRMQRLVNDLLDFALIEAGAFKLKRASANFGDKVREALDLVRPQADKEGLTLAIALPEAPLVLGMDPQRVEQVLINLLDNAIKFTPRGGTITVRAEIANGLLRCEVGDSGIGLAAEDLPKLFKRFAQIKANYRKGGTGLGLSIVKALVEAHFAPGEPPPGGAVGVESQVGVGSTFWFVLPQTPGP